MSEHKTKRQRRQVQALAAALHDPRVRFSVDELQAIKRAIARTWDAIGHDATEAHGGYLRTEDVPEIVLDANYLETYGTLLHKSAAGARASYDALIERFRSAPRAQQYAIARQALR